MTTELIVICISLTLQLISAMVAFYVITSTGKRVAGALMLLVIVLMAFRRSISLYRYFDGSDIKVDLYAEILGMVISFLILIGVIYMYRLIDSLRTLTGLIPLCSSCHKVRDDQGSWTRIEEFLRERSLADVSHGICPDCAVKLYPKYAAQLDLQKKA